MKKRRIKVKHPIGVKLGAIFAGLVILVLGITVALVYILFANDQRVNAKSNTISLNETTANAVQTKLQNIQGSVNNYLNVIYVISEDEDFEEEQELFFKELCNANDDLLFIYDTDSGYKAAPAFGRTNPKADELFSRWVDRNPILVGSVLGGTVEIKDLSNVVDKPYVLGIMFKNNGKFVCVGFNVEALKETCFKNSNATYVVNSRGEALIYEDNQTVLDAGLVPSFEIVTEVLSNSSGNEYVFQDSKGDNWIYIRMNILDNSCSVITLTSESSILKAINLTALRIIAFSVAVFFLAILIIRFFSRSLTNPIEDLVAATHSIDKGNYNIHLRPRTKDEIGYLTDRFTKMSKGLAERQRLMSTFTKFVNKDIAEKAASGQLTLGGEDKNATVFFSDIRSFTAMSQLSVSMNIQMLV